MNEDLLNECRADAALIYAGKRAHMHVRSQEDINLLHPFTCSPAHPYRR